jgi:16S rRNA (guanine966-N2)-methyltransferase
MNNTSKRNRVRIIGGDWRSRVLDFADLPELRPTPDRVRETLFNWLQFSITGARCLDPHPQAVAALRDNAKALGTSALEVLQKDAMQWLEQPALRQFNVVFLDPPFAAGLHARCYALLQANGWLAAGAKIYLESGDDLETLALPAQWSLTRHKRAGDVHYGLCETGAA